MIRTEAQLRQVVEQMGRLYIALAELKRRVEPENKTVYSLMTEGPLDQIREFQEQIDEYVGVAALREDEADLWLRIQAPGVRSDNAPTSVLTTFIGALRTGVQLVAEFFDTGSVSSRPTKDLMAACDLRLIGLAPGSVQLGLRLPENDEDSGPGKKRAIVESALSHYLFVAAQAANGNVQAIEVHYQDVILRRILLNAVKPLLPAKRGAIEMIELHGRRLDGGPVRLTRETHDAIDEALDRTIPARPESRTGVLREIDLDQCTFLLRDGKVKIRCSFPPELYEAAKEAIDHRVRVFGTRPRPQIRKAAQLYVERLELAEDGADGNV